jgi:hypothetical protein
LLKNQEVQADDITVSAPRERVDQEALNATMDRMEKKGLAAFPLDAVLPYG